MDSYQTPYGGYAPTPGYGYPPFYPNSPYQWPNMPPQQYFPQAQAYNVYPGQYAEPPMPTMLSSEQIQYPDQIQDESQHPQADLSSDHLQEINEDPVTDNSPQEDYFIPSLKHDKIKALLQLKKNQNQNIISGFGNAIQKFFQGKKQQSDNPQQQSDHSQKQSDNPQQNPNVPTGFPTGFPAMPRYSQYGMNSQYSNVPFPSYSPPPGSFPRYTNPMMNGYAPQQMNPYWVRPNPWQRSASSQYSTYTGPYTSHPGFVNPTPINEEVTSAAAKPSYASNDPMQATAPDQPRPAPNLDHIQKQIIKPTEVFHGPRATRSIKRNRR
ncbi:hypothetical protein DSO57_1011005 [Entomophthora muscae]|uniref:Uncharacterized protein n=1 Tax=Entomophthora muscae TaxID=34485 RepID=A0ACC2RL66_9FUNG|nr:hypothetical protein DSO57_1011005 [Entomophthora muscae]